MKKLEDEIANRLQEVNRLKHIVPQNIVLVTTQDVAEIFHELVSYTAKMYDELQTQQASQKESTIKSKEN